jgi:hypothetical protein
MSTTTGYRPYVHLEAPHIYALGTPWTDACGMVLLTGGGDARKDIQNLALTSCSAEMALEPLRKIMGSIHAFHADIAGIHSYLMPVQAHVQAAISSIEAAEKCYEQWRTRNRS